MLSACNGAAADGHPNDSDQELPNAVPQWLPSPPPNPSSPLESPILWNYERPTPEGFEKARALVKEHDLCGNFGRVALKYRPFDLKLPKMWKYLREIRGQYVPLSWRGKNFYLLRDFEVVADPVAFATQRKADGANQPRSRRFPLSLSDTIDFSKHGLNQDSYKDDISPVDQIRAEELSAHVSADTRNHALAEIRPYSELMSPIYYGVAFVETGATTLSGPASARLGSTFILSSSGLQPRMLIQPDEILDSYKLTRRSTISYDSPRIDEAIFGRLTQVAQIDDAIVYDISNDSNDILAVLLPDQKDSAYLVCR
ncbi:hypothetical protein [Sphingopyxis sp.]|uniref:hypothetical protein n=1 Tax=Sphingopyxis sp. TaxID=1908224 RepID=UPI002E340241|nr:hypothetical protein [Sphingopyxis sp.]